jgi:hypothetical protein
MLVAYAPLNNGAVQAGLENTFFTQMLNSYNPVIWIINQFLPGWGK